MIPDWIGAYLLSASAIGAKQFVVQEAAEMIVVFLPLYMQKVYPHEFAIESKIEYGST